MTLPMSEEQLLQTIRQAAHLMGWRTYHTRDSRMSDPGFPDLVMLRVGRLIVAELKSEHGRVSPEQQDWLDAFRRIPGVEVYVWRPADLDEALKVLK